jgi:CBS domain-containing protein/sporulation protein YlmC with PRC-barrel domain
MVLFSEMFFSEIDNVPVIDRFEKHVGRVKDVLLVLGEQFPRVSGVLVKVDGGKEKVLTIGEIDLIGPQFVATRSTRDRIVFSSIRPDDILLKKNILDQQVVDTNGARVLRVNDLKLAKVGPDVRLIAADVGMRGMLRRLNIEWLFDLLFGLFGKKVPDKLIGWNYVELLEADLAKGQIKIPHKRVEELHPSDIANIISRVHTDERRAIFASLSDKTAAEALHELEPKIQAMLLMTIDTKKALNILNRMPVDEAADVLGDLPEEKTEELLRLMGVRKSVAIRKLLKHPETTAGGLMTSEFITFPQELTAEAVINKLREIAPEAETIYYLYVVDPAGKLTGILSLRRLIVAAPSAVISDIMVKNIISVPAEINQRQVAEIISKYNLLAVPVVDSDGRVLGIVTVDDVMDFILPPISRRKRQMLG